MTRKNKIIIAVSAVVLVIIIIALVWFFWPSKTVDQPAVGLMPEGVIPQILPVTPGLSDNPPVEIGQPQLEANLKAVSITFAERFGSYSNQSDFQNLEDLQGLMTVKMKGWADNFVLEQSANDLDSTTYYGITTQGLSSVIIDFDESLGRAEVLVNTQRQEAKGDTINPRVFYQEIKLRLVKTGTGWKVDEAEWQ